VDLTGAGGGWGRKMRRVRTGTLLWQAQDQMAVHPAGRDRGRSRGRKPRGRSRPRSRRGAQAPARRPRKSRSALRCLVWDLCRSRCSLTPALRGVRSGCGGFEAPAPAVGMAFFRRRNQLAQCPRSARVRRDRGRILSARAALGSFQLAQCGFAGEGWNWVWATLPPPL